MQNKKMAVPLLLGSTKIEFHFRRVLDHEDYVDVHVTMAGPRDEPRWQSMPTMLALPDLARLADYIQMAIEQGIDYAYVPMNLGFELLAYDSDNYTTTIDLFLLADEPDDGRRSYIGCRGAVLNDELIAFTNWLRDCATQI